MWRSKTRSMWGEMYVECKQLVRWQKLCVCVCVCVPLKAYTKVLKSIYTIVYTHAQTDAHTAGSQILPQEALQMEWLAARQVCQWARQELCGSLDHSNGTYASPPAICREREREREREMFQLKEYIHCKKHVNISMKCVCNLYVSCWTLYSYC